MSPRKQGSFMTLKGKKSPHGDTMLNYLRSYTLISSKKTYEIDGFVIVSVHFSTCVPTEYQDRIRSQKILSFLQ